MIKAWRVTSDTIDNEAALTEYLMHEDSTGSKLHFKSNLITFIIRQYRTSVQAYYICVFRFRDWRFWIWNDQSTAHLRAA